MNNDAASFNTKQVDLSDVDFEYTGNRCCKITLKLLSSGATGRNALNACVDGHGKNDSCLAEQSVVTYHKPLRANDARCSCIAVIIIGS
jgi:hypothetical protein